MYTLDQNLLYRESTLNIRIKQIKQLPFPCRDAEQDNPSFKVQITSLSWVSVINWLVLASRHSMSVKRPPWRQNPNSFWSCWRLLDSFSPDAVGWFSLIQLDHPVHDGGDDVGPGGLVRIVGLGLGVVLLTKLTFFAISKLSVEYLKVAVSVQPDWSQTYSLSRHCHSKKRFRVATEMDFRRLRLYLAELTRIFFICSGRTRCHNFT